MEFAQFHDATLVSYLFMKSKNLSCQRIIVRIRAEVHGCNGAESHVSDFYVYESLQLFPRNVIQYYPIVIRE